MDQFLYKVERVFFTESPCLTIILFSDRLSYNGADKVTLQPVLTLQLSLYVL